MPSSQWQIGRARDFRGGETQAELPEEVGQNQLIRMENAMIYPSGWLTAAHQLDTRVVSNAFAGLSIVEKADGTYHIYNAPGDDIVYDQFLDTASDAAVDMSLGSQSNVEGAHFVGVQKAVHFLGKDYCPNPYFGAFNGILNLTDMVLISVFNGETPYVMSTPSKLRRHMNRLWLINPDGTLHISDNGDAATWNPMNVALLPNSEPFIDFFPVQGGAIAYQHKAIYAMYGGDYTDISFIELIAGEDKHFTTGAVEISGTVFILSTEGVYQVTLNGAQLIPHHQEPYFRSMNHIFSDPSKQEVSAIYMQSFKAILFTWPVSYSIGGQSLVFYLTGAYSKLNRLVPANYPYPVAMNDANTDFLWPVDYGALVKSQYPSSNLVSPQRSVIQTRHEDCGSNRDKVWSEFVITVDAPVYGVFVDMVLDDSDEIKYRVADGISLQKGENTIWLDELPRSKTISTIIEIDNTTVMNIVSDDDSSLLLVDENGNELVTGVNPGNWIIKELRLRYRLAGPDL